MGIEKLKDEKITDFIIRAKQTHGEKYSYQNSIYVNCKVKIVITCRSHGDFEQRCSDHINGSGCPLCAKGFIKSPQEDFITSAKKIYGDKYDYKNVVYTLMRKKVEIICRKHGSFFQSCRSHLENNNESCPSCREDNNNKKFVNFIKKAKDAHGDKYDYSKVFLETGKKGKKITIICQEHGEFEQCYSKHIRGAGCPHCVKYFQKSNVEDFITKARKVHGDRYHYNDVEYENNKVKVKISCPNHGFFLQSPNNHLNGYGCSLCARGLTKSIKNSFIEKSKKIHGNKYSYQKVKMERLKDTVSLSCKKHGFFTITARSHLEGRGCEECRIEDNTKKFIAKAHSVHGENYSYDNIGKIIGKCKEYITITCLNHGDFKQEKSSHLEGNGCPSCRKSKGELKIAQLLKEKNIPFSEQKTFKGCRNPSGGLLRFDFYVPALNLVIEFDGLQHFKPVSIFGGKERFERQLKSDRLKDEYCRLHRINILRIKYNQNIELALEDILNHLKNNNETVCIFYGKMKMVA